ncbi:MAG: hypothetical protein OXE53_15160 [Deltaproteobacteria bacterium]|nr:hypothetical protein [Deltaproteobacteria bacterium]
MPGKQGPSNRVLKPGSAIRHHHGVTEGLRLQSVCGFVLVLIVSWHQQSGSSKDVFIVYIQMVTGPELQDAC